MAKKILFLLFSILFFSVSAGENNLSAARFMEILRSGLAAKSNSTYAILNGYAEHIRRGDDEVKEYPIFMGVIINPERSVTQIIIGEDEGYFVGQSRQNSIIPMHKNLADGTSKLEQCGIDPADLSMNFIHYDLVEELAKEKVKLVDCRVFLLKKPQSDELVKIFVAEQYFFTLKAEFFKNSDLYQKNTPARTLEINSFKKQNDLYYVEKLNIFGPGWRTIVEFEEAEINIYNPTDNKLIFRKLKK
jgi:hypothetical protein